MFSATPPRRCSALALAAGAALALALPTSVAAQAPPANPFLVDSPFPIVHGNNYRQGYSELPALRGVDSVRVQTARTPSDRVSPWLQVSAPYGDGEHAFFGSTSTHFWKAVAQGDRFDVVSEYVIDSDPAINDLSWAFVLLGDHRYLTYDDSRLIVLADDPASSTSELREERIKRLPPVIGAPAKLTPLYDGNIAFASEIGILGVLDRDLNLLDTLRLAVADGEDAFHNDFASDETGGIYTVTTERMLKLQWDGQQLSQVWEVPMDFGGNAIQGVGTTPTLIGGGAQSDHLVCVIDSKVPARMIAFWRGDVPADFTPLDGFDERVAAITPLPGSGPISALYTAVENSPVAYGYELACGQYNGLLGQNCDAARGVYKLRWDTTANTLDLQWQRDDINLNNVLQYSVADDLLYGSGREDDCLYYYYGLDWDTGETVARFALGAEGYYDDPGNANVILPDSSIVFNSKERLVRVRPAAAARDADTSSTTTAVVPLAPGAAYPNPTSGPLAVDLPTGWSDGAIVARVVDATGRTVAAHRLSGGEATIQFEVSELARGLYVLSLRRDGEEVVVRFRKT